MGLVWTGAKNLGPHWNSIPRPSSQQSVTTSTEISRSSAVGVIIENGSVLPQRESQKFLVLPGFKPRHIQHHFGHCTDCGVRGPMVSILKYDKTLENKGSVYRLCQAECRIFISILKSSVTMALHRPQIM